MVRFLNQAMAKHTQARNIPHHHSSTRRAARKRKQFGLKPASGSIVLSPAEEKENLTALVKMLLDESSPERDWQLNGWGHADAERLRRWVTALLEARTGREGDAQLIPRMKLSAQDRKRLADYTYNIHAGFWPDGTLVLLDDPNDPAAFRFTRFLRSSERTKSLLGRQCKRDGCPKKWYERRTPRASVFCSRECAREDTQVKNRKSARDKKLKLIRETIETYEALPRNSIYRQPDCRTYVSKELKDTISKKFLTQVIESGEVSLPRKG